MITREEHRIKVEFDETQTIMSVETKGSKLSRSSPAYGCVTQHFYTLEEPMDQKKEMAAKDAWIAMANGECVKSFRKIFRIYDGCLLVWSLTLETWQATTTIDVGPYSIVPDPSKPVESEYKKDRKAVINAIQFAYLSDERTSMIELLEKWYVRKGEL